MSTSRADTPVHHVEVTAAVSFTVTGFEALGIDEWPGSTLAPQKLTVNFRKQAGAPWAATRVVVRGKARGPETGAGPSAMYFWLPRDEHRLTGWLRELVSAARTEVLETLAVTTEADR